MSKHQPYDGIKTHAGENTEVAHNFNDWDTDSAADLVKEADVAIVFSSADSGEAIASVDGNLGDRNNLTLWNNGDNLASRNLYVYIPNLSF